MQEAIDKNHPRFSRRSSTFPPGVPTGRRGSGSRMSADLSPLRRTPSPKRRGITHAEGLESPVIVRQRMSSGSSNAMGMRKISLEELHFLDQGGVKRHKRTSHVLVMPSLATLTHTSTDPLTPVPENTGAADPLKKS